MCKLIVKNKTKNYINFNPLTQVVILLTVCHTVLVMFVWRICIGSTYIPLIYIFLYSYHLSARYCIDVVRKNSVLVTQGIMSYFIHCPEPFHSQDKKINALLCTSYIYYGFGFDNFLSNKTIYPSLCPPFFLITFLFECVLIL